MLKPGYQLILTAAAASSGDGKIQPSRQTITNKGHPSTQNTLQNSSNEGLYPISEPFSSLPRVLSSLRIAEI